MLRSLVPHSIKRRLRKFVWMRLNPLWTLRSGIVIRVLSYSDWMIYNDIFVDGEYDDAIDQMLGAKVDPPGTLQVLDLGANVGFFTLRLADKFLQKARANFNVIAIEGSPSNHRELRERIAANENVLGDRVRTINRLVGERSGVGNIAEGDSCGENTIVHHSARCVPVPFVNLDELTRSWADVDLLKCDIEGAEEMFLENYPDLLRKIARAVFEFHHDRCNIARCRHLLCEAGLKHSRTLREFGRCSVELFQRAS